MKSPAVDDQYDPQQTQERLRKILRGAFSGPPTPLEDIPKRTGVSRKIATAKRRASAHATAKSEQP